MANSKLFMTLCLAVAVTAALGPTARAAPSISSVSGSITQGSTITVSGSSFGSGPSGVVFDDFELGTDGNDIMTGSGSARVGQWDSTSGLVYYTNDHVRSGSLAFEADHSTDWLNYVRRNFPSGVSKVFVCCWVYCPTVFPGEATPDGLNWKHIWIQGNTAGDDDIFLAFQGGDSNANYYLGGNCGTDPVYTGWARGGIVDSGDWFRGMFYVEGGITDGHFDWDLLHEDNTKKHVEHDGQTWGNDSYLPYQYESVRFNGYGRQTQNCYPIHDDCYSAYGDNCRARVEIGNASTYSSCTDLAISGPTSWSSSSITAKCNVGGLGTGNWYLFVIDAANNASAGYQVVGGGPTYTLTVNSGSGDGSYTENQVVDITADTAASGYVFDEWTGDTSGIADVNDSTTTITMPAANAEITATYEAATFYTLTVNSGSGDGSYTENQVVDITADTAASGYVFDEWTGDTSGIADVNDSTTTITMPAANAEITATYEAATFYTLTVNSGSGDGSYTESQVVDITADTAASGYVFDEWTGDTSGIADTGDPTTTITMPASDVEITATYEQAVTYALTVNSGSGDGSYSESTVVDISADSPPSGQQFEEWVGDTSGIANVNASSTTLTMPAANAEITATYEDAAAGTTQLIVNWGDSAGNNVFDFSDWDDVYLGEYTGYSSLGPDGLIAGWTGTSMSGRVGGSSESFSEGDQIKVTWYNSKTSSLTFTPKISFDDPDKYNSGTSGTWYDMTQLNCPAQSSGTTTYTFTSGTAGSYTLVNVCRYTNGCNEMIMDKIELVTDGGAAQYTLTVNSGSGDGSYTESQVVDITADTAASGYVFDEWTGDTSGIADAGDPTTTITMPAANAEITATYTNVTLYTLTVNSGTGDGNYQEGWVVDISADAAPSGKYFNEWVGDTGGIANVESSSTTLTMPASDAQITATYMDIEYTLTVNSGTGDGSYAEDAVADIDADAAPSGQEFDEWVGDTSGIASVTTADTTLTMPAADQEVTATYTDKTWTLTVNSGTGDGSYVVAAIADIDADAPASGKQFDEWIGDTTGIASVTTADTTLTMPYSDAEITATYEDIATYTLTVNSGTGDGSYAESAVPNIAADAAPSGQDFDEWVGDTSGIADTSDPTTTLTMPAANQEVTATYTDKTWTLTVNNGTGDGNYVVGTVQPITADAAPSGQDFDEWTGDVTGIADVNDPTTTITMPYADAEITATYTDKTWTLTVNSGTGDGSYVVATVVDIDADTPASGKQFDDWTGDVTGIADVNDPTTTITMPYADAEITATYEDIPAGYTLTVNSGTGDGDYSPSTVVDIDADAAASGMLFDAWTGDTSNISDVNDPSGTLTMPASNQEITATYTWVVSGLVSRFTFDTDARDTYGTNDGTLTDGASVTTDGTRGKVLSLDGTNDYVDLPTSGLTGGRSELTLSMWIKPDETTAANTIWDEHNDWYWQFSILQGTWYTRDSSTGTTGSRNNDLSMPSLSSGTWQHLAFVYSVSGSDKAIYLDGEEDTSTSTSVDALTSDRTGAYIGRPSEIEYYDGLIDDVRLYSRALNSTEIALLAETTPPTTYTLTVNSGSGDGDYAEDAVADIDADTAPSGQDFDEWVGDTSGIASVSTADTTLTMPASNQEITATYTDKTWTLTVNSGTGDGSYVVAAVVDIDADTPASGKQFDEWVGDTAGIADVDTADTTLTMPYADVEITATYEDVPSGTTQLIVNWGSSSGNNVYDFSDWDSVYLGPYTAYSSEGPDGIKGGFTGMYHTTGVNGSSESFSEGDQIKVTWYNYDSSGKTISPKISFDDEDYYSGGVSSGTWYDMTQQTIPAEGSAATTYTFTSGTAGSYSRVHVSRATNNAEYVICDKIELVTD